VGGNGQPAAPATATPHAAVTASQHGGLRGGKPRKDGKIPGSPEAIAADLEKDAKRKRDGRAAKKTASDPAAIPSANSPGQTTANGVAAVPGAAGNPPVPWDPSLIAPLIKQILPTAQKMATRSITSRAEKAHLPGELIHDIEKEATWNPMAIQAIEISAPQVAAKWLNKTGVSAEHQPEIMLGTAICSILGSQVLLLNRLDKLIKVANEAKPAAPATPAQPTEEKKP